MPHFSLTPVVKMVVEKMAPEQQCNNNRERCCHLAHTNKIVAAKCQEQIDTQMWEVARKKFKFVAKAVEIEFIGPPSLSERQRERRKMLIYGIVA